jgi:hypothetical protein
MTQAENQAFSGVETNEGRLPVQQPPLARRYINGFVERYSPPLDWATDAAVNRSR